MKVKLRLVSSRKVSINVPKLYVNSIGDFDNLNLPPKSGFCIINVIIGTYLSKCHAVCDLSSNTFITYFNFESVETYKMLLVTFLSLIIILLINITVLMIFLHPNYL